MAQKVKLFYAFDFCFEFLIMRQNSGQKLKIWLTKADVRILAKIWLLPNLHNKEIRCSGMFSLFFGHPSLEIRALLPIKIHAWNLYQKGYRLCKLIIIRRILILTIFGHTEQLRLTTEQLEKL